MSKSSSHKTTIHDIDWYAVACKIRRKNEQLKSRIAQLESIIAQQKEPIEAGETGQQLKDSNTQQKITQLTEEIEAHKRHISQLTEEIEKLQKQVALLERECSFLQENCNEKEVQLRRLEQENRELKIRLQRQQRYAIEYKTALEQLVGNNNVSLGKSFEPLKINSWSADRYQEENPEEIAGKNKTKSLELPLDFPLKNPPETQENQVEREEKRKPVQLPRFSNPQKNQ